MLKERKSDTKGSIRKDSIHMKFKTRQNESVVLQLMTVDSIWEERGGTREAPGAEMLTFLIWVILLWVYSFLLFL